MRRLFGRLVVVHADGEPTRRRATRTELTAERPEARLPHRTGGPTLDSSASTVTARAALPTVEPAHEALLREWPRLRRWIEEDRAGLLALAQLRETRPKSWVELKTAIPGRSTGVPPRGRARCSRLRQRSPTTEREFLEASDMARRRREPARKLAQVERQARANRRLLPPTGGHRHRLGDCSGRRIRMERSTSGSAAVDERRVAFGRELAAGARGQHRRGPRAQSAARSPGDRRDERMATPALPEAIGALHEAIS